MPAPEPGRDGLRRYAKWAGNPAGHVERTTDCVEEVFPNERGAVHRQCSNRRGYGPGGLYCRRHVPGTVQAKRDEQEQQWRDREATSDRNEKRARQLAARLGCGQAHYRPGQKGGLGGYVEALVVDFADIERILERLDNK